jgi:hypothetical protein
MAQGDFLLGLGFVFFFFISFAPHSNHKHFEESGTKHQGHHANGNDANLAPNKNAKSTIRRSYQLNY